MSLTASDVESLTFWLSVWEKAEYGFAGLVTVGCLGEFVAEFTDWFTSGVEDNKKLLTKRSTLLLIASLALELVCLVKTNQLSGRIIGSLDEKAREAGEKAQAALDKSDNAVTHAGLAEESSTRAAGKSEKAEKSASSALSLAGSARQEADSFEQDIVSAKTQATQAETHLADALQRAASAETRAVQTGIELARFKAPRSLDSAQLERIREKMAAFPKTMFDLYVNSESEAVDLMNQIDGTLRSAGWTFTAAGGDTILYNHRAGLVSVSGVLIEISPERVADLKSPVEALAMALVVEGIETRAEAHVDVTKNKNAIHVIIGSKPIK
jgi:hypothetical protein